MEAPDVSGKRGRRRGLVLSFSDLQSDPRVRRQLDLLVPDFTVTAVGFRCPSGVPISCFSVPDQHWRGLGKIRAATLLKLRRFESLYWSSRCVLRARVLLQNSVFDFILANDIWTLPLALELKGRGKVIFDAHEYAPREFEDKWKWRFFFQKFNEYLCRCYLPMADARTTVSDGIAREYERSFGTPMTVVANAAPYYDLQPRVAAQGDEIRLVHHGAAIPSRRLELMIEAMDHLDARFQLDLLLVPSVPRYFDQLVSLASHRKGVRILPPVPMLELPRVLNQYDVGLFLLPPTNFNYRFALPNKFFEFVQARLAIAIGPSPEMASYVHSHDIGVVSADFTAASFARVLSTLDRDRIKGFKARADVAARELCFEKSADVLREVISNALLH